MTIVDQAEVREAIDPVAYECADLLRQGAERTFSAAVKFSELNADAPSHDWVAEQVSKAGFQISRRTVSRSLAALDGLALEANPSTETLALFWEQYSRAGAHVAANAGDNEWYTPPEYITAARLVMGGIDLDPASTYEANEVVRAEKIYTEGDNGLAHGWGGRVWMNPPYARPLIDEFCAKLAEEYAADNVKQAITLTNNATETGWFHALAEVGAAIAFPRHRVKFWHPRKEATPLQGQACFYLGENIQSFRDEFVQFGFTVTL